MACPPAQVVESIDINNDDTSDDGLGRKEGSPQGADIPDADEDGDNDLISAVVPAAANPPAPTPDASAAVAAAAGAAAEEAEAWLPGSGGGFLVMLYLGGGFKEAEVTSEAAPATAAAGLVEDEDKRSPGTCPGATWRWGASAASPDLEMDGSFPSSLALELLILAALAPLLVTGFSSFLVNSVVSSHSSVGGFSKNITIRRE